uniref:DM domain-containing protein n=1 Tax=Leptobrachium leishanense TaxID=445787 RepID=A0A8C5PIB9_9ANUR
MSNPERAQLGPIRVTRVPKCSRCRNHGVVVPVRGHSGRCEWKACTCSKCSLITERHKIMAAHKQLRRPGSEEEESGSAGVETVRHMESGDSGERRQESGTPVPLQPIMPKSEYFERDVSRMYINCPPMYRYPPLSMAMAVNHSSFRSPACPTAIPMRGFRQYQPLQDAGGDFRPNYYPPVPQFMSPTFMHGLHYLPPPLPMGVNMMAEPSRDMLGQIPSENQSIKTVYEKNPNGEPGT